MIFVRSAKIWMVVCLSSLGVWIAYWVPTSVERLYDFIFLRFENVIQYLGPMYFTMEVSAAVGTIIRSVGVVFGLLSIFFLSKKYRNFFDIRKYVAIALAVECFYYATLFPSGLVMIGVGSRFLTSVPLGISYLLQVLFTVPFLAVLAYKVYTYEKEPNGFKSWIWVGLAFVGYVVALWSNSVLRWLSMASSEGISYLLTGSTGVGFLSTAILMSLAVVFSIIGGLKISKGRVNSSLIWIGLALSSIVLQYLIYVIYHYYYSMLSYVWLSDPWTVPLLGLGLILIWSRKKARND